MDEKQTLSGDEIRALDGMNDWRAMFDSLQSRFRTGDFRTGLAMLDRVAEEAEEQGHHPDLDLRYGLLNVRLSSHDVGGKTMRDVTMARRISAIAADLGVTADPASVSRLEIALDTSDSAAIAPFWQAVYGKQPDPSAYEVTDGEGDLPALWFQDSAPHDEPRQRFHLDLRVPPEVADVRIAAALAAGGKLVSDAEAPRFTVLADPQGNKVCICTHVTRSH